MKTRLLRELILLITVVSIQVYPQIKTSGTISGKVVDAETGEPIIGANVVLEEILRGASTDIEGKYTIAGIFSGKYSVMVSALSYAKKRFTDVNVEEGKVTVLTLTLSQEAITTQEVVVEAIAEGSYEGVLLARQKNASVISDGISAEQIKRTPDATSGNVLKRIPGVTIVDNKFVYVRGTSERYSNTTLNGTAISGSEPEKKSFSFDMFPSNLLESIVIAKTFTPDVSGDFAGGNVQLRTIEFPEYFIVRATISSGYNTETTFKNFQSYNGGGRDWLGMDDGTRSLPGGLPGDFTKTNLTIPEINNFASLFENNWTPKNKNAPLNSGMEISIGNAYNLFEESQFGFIAALTYKNNYTSSVIDRNDYQSNGPKFEYLGSRSNFSVLWGGLINASYKFNPFHKISSKNVYNKSADDEVTYLQGVDYDGPNEKRTTGFRFVERSVVSSQILGEHVFTDFNAIKLQWRISNSESKRDEPDYRRVTYFRDVAAADEPFRALIDYQAQTRSGGRFYSSLKDIVRNYGVDFTIPIEKTKLKVGGLYEDKDRGFNSRLIAFTAPFGAFDFNILYYAIDSLFSSQNVKQDGLRLSEYSNGSNNYTAGHTVTAYYAMVDVPFAALDQKFRFISGARIENFAQVISSVKLDGSPLKENPRNVDVLPSINLTYLINEVTNIRLAYSQTVNRPELRELAPFAYYDFSSQVTIYGNEKLKRALIKNYDIRYEVFPNPGEILSFSVFYKDMKDAIEQVVVPGSALGADRTYDNASGKAKNLGYEIEFRTSLGNITEILGNVGLSGNFTRVESKVNVLTGVGLEKRDRPLQGQSPYMINLGLIYTLAPYGLNAALSYNKFGERISEVATLYDEDIREMPRNLLDFTITKSITQNLEGKFSLKDIFSEAQVFKIGEKIARKNTMGTTYSLSFSYKL